MPLTNFQNDLLHGKHPLQRQVLNIWEIKVPKT